MSPIIGALGAALLTAGGIWLALGSRGTRSEGVARLRAALETDAENRNDAALAPLAAVWSQLARRVDDAGRGGPTFAWMGAALERAGWPLRPGELTVALVAAAAGGALLGGLLSNAVLAGGFALAGFVFPLLLLLRAERRISKRADAQLPDVLGALASSMRSGHSLVQALDAVGEQADTPLGPELHRVVAETRIGRTLGEALEAMADRVGSTDLRWTVRAMSIQARTGGPLADILDVLAEFMREREEVRREVAALTADGRMSAWVLGALPFVVTGALLVMSPDYLLALFADPLGWVLVLVAAALMTVGMFWIRRIVAVEV